MKAIKDALEGLTEEVRAKVVGCESAEELQGLLDDEGLDVDQELLAGIAVGRGHHCPYLYGRPFSPQPLPL